MTEMREIADELRDDVLQTILAVRLNLSHSVARGDYSAMVRHASEAQGHLETEARRLQDLVRRLERLDRSAPGPG